MSAELNGNLTPEEQLTGALDTSAQLVGSLNTGSGGGGTDDYNDLSNKPKINNVTLSGNKTTDDLGLFSGDYTDLTNKPTIPTELNDLSDVHLPSYTPTDYVFLGLPPNSNTWTTVAPELVLSINDFSDIAIESPTNGQSLVYRDGYWENNNVSYYTLTGLPKINDVTLSGNKTTADLGLFSGNYNDLTNKPLFSVITRSKTMSLAAGASGYFQLDDVLNFPASNSYLIGFFGYAALTYATRGTIMSAGLIENGAKPYIHYQVGEAGFSDVPFYFRFVFYTP